MIDCHVRDLQQSWSMDKGCDVIVTNNRSYMYVLESIIFPLHQRLLCVYPIRGKVV